MRRALLLAAGLCGVVLLSGVALATEYHVGSGQTYATMNALLSAVTLGDNDIAWVHPGTYGSFAASSGGGSSQATAVQIRAYDPNNKPIFSGGTNCIAIQSGATKWWKLDGLEQKSSTSRGIYHTCGGLTIQNCYVHNNAQDGIMSGMCNTRPANPGTLIVEYCELASNGSGTQYHSWYVQENSMTARYNWTHNENGGIGYKDRSRTSLLEYNLIEEGSSSAGCAISFCGWDDSEMPDVGQTATMVGNVVTKSGGGNTWLFVNNIRMADGGNAGQTAPGYLYLYNNSFYSENHTGPMLADDEVSIIAAHNNIFHSASCTSMYDQVDGAAGPGQVLTSYNNWVKSTMSRPAAFTNTVTGSAPGWVNTATSGGDFHLTSGSACINAGRNSVSVLPTKEYSHPCSYTTRPSDGTIDIGAYEYSGAPQPPVANFTGNPTSGYIPLTVAFTDTSTNSPTSWSWTFGDGGTSTSQSPSHQYTTAGSYTVTLTATNAAGSDGETKTNYITANALPPAPVANFTGTPTSGTAPLTVAFTDTSTNSPTSWSWTFGDGGTSTAQNPSHTYTTTGSKTVALTATNAGGNNTNTKTNYITVSAPPAPVANFTGTPTSGTAPLTVAFTDTSTNSPTSWSWTFGDGGTSTAQNPSHTYASAGSYTVALTATNAGGNNTNTKNNYISVQASTMPTFVAAGAVASGTGAITPALPAGIATNDILLLFLETANQAISISNQNGGTWTAVANSPQGTGTAGGSNATRLTVFWSRYNGTQGAPTTSDSGNHQLGRIVAIRGAATSGNPWDVTAGGVESTADTSGAIPGATTTVANTLVVAAIATALPDADGTADFSAWTNANLTSVTERTDNTVTAGNGGGLGIATGGKATAGAYGTTTVTCATAARKGMMSIALKPPAGGSAPVADFSGTPTSGTAPLTVTFTDSSTNSPTSWSWTFGDGGTSTSQNPSHQYTAAGTYTVALTATNAYGNNTNTKPSYITVTSGGGEVTLFSDHFASGLGNWTAIGSPSTCTCGSDPNVHYARLRCSPDVGIQRTISTSGRSTIKVHFVGRMFSGANSGAYFQALWYDGSTWTELMRIDAAAADGVFRTYDYTLPSAANNNPNFAVKFFTHGTDWHDDAMVDDVIVKGT